MLLQVPLTSSFSLLSAVSLNQCTTICFSIHQLMDIWFISSFHLLRIELLQTDKYLYGHMFLFLFSKYQGVRFWGCILKYILLYKKRVKQTCHPRTKSFPYLQPIFSVPVISFLQCRLYNQRGMYQYKIPFASIALFLLL